MTSVCHPRESSGDSVSLLKRPFRSLNDDVEELLHRLSLTIGGDFPAFFHDTLPSMDLAETATTIVVTVDLPGLKPDEVDIEVTGNRLRINGQRADEGEDKSKKFHRIERSRRSFFRVINLPCDVEQEAVAAVLRDGVLHVTLPKCEDAKAHRISVKG